MTTETRTFWLSFCDGKKPAGQRFLGVCIVDVTAADAQHALLDLTLRFPRHAVGAEWIAAASRNAHRAGCNPGGEMASLEIEAASPTPLPKDRLLSFDELNALGFEPVSLSEFLADEPPTSSSEPS